jgi:ABC-type multidrug transport system fused ATPase/permease subunit
VYSRAKTVYLDDVLSAVDAHTARFLYQECLRGDLLKGRTVVLVSHNVNLVLPCAKFVIQLGDGRIQKWGSKEIIQGESTRLERKRPLHLSDSTETEPNSETTSITISDAQQLPKEIRQIYEEEKREIGQVRSRHYIFLLRAAGGPFYWLIFAVLYCGAQVFSFLEALWLKYWTSDPRHDALTYYLSGYAIIVTSGIFFGALRWVWLYGVRLGGASVGFCDRAAPRIHAMMLASLVRSPMVFFATWPTGRILNRFSEDLNRLDSFISDDFGRSVTAGKLSRITHIVTSC